MYLLKLDKKEWNRFAIKIYLNYKTFTTAAGKVAVSTLIQAMCATR
jgi:hypothetical protein